MRAIALGRSLFHYLEHIEFTEAGLSADPHAAILAAPYSDALVEWEDLFKRERAARREVVRADAVVAVRNEQLDATTMKFAAMVRAAAADLLERLFHLAPGKFVRTTLRKQCEKTKSVILPELGKLPSGHALKPFANQLDSLSHDALTALDHRAAVAGSRQSVANDVLEWKEGINALRTTTYAELLKISAAQGLPKSWVESFFRQAGESDNDDDTPPPAAPATNT